MFKRKDYINTYNTNKLVESNEMLGNKIVSSNRELINTFKAISAAELREKNRVDISLSEYESMKEELEMYRARESTYNHINDNLLRCFGFSIEELKMQPNSINWETMYDPVRDESAFCMRFSSKGNPFRV